MNNPAQSQTVAAQNALTGERTTMQVVFAITGNVDADVISGSNAVIMAVLPGHHPRPMQRIFEFLAARYNDSADYRERTEIQTSPMYSTGGLGASAQQAAPMSVFMEDIGKGLRTGIKGSE